MIWTVGKWSLLVVVGSLAGIVMVIAWDWFFWRRMPHVRWKMSQLPPNEINILREITRIRRIKPTPPESNGDGTAHATKPSSPSR